MNMNSRSPIFYAIPSPSPSTLSPYQPSQKKTFTKVLEYQVLSTEKFVMQPIPFLESKNILLWQTLPIYSNQFWARTLIILDPSSHIFFVKSKKKLEIVEIIGKP